jgi:Acyltransferase family
VPVQPMRVQALDNLKVVLISAIIAIHGVLGYAGYDEWWSYADVQETVLRPETEIILMVLVGPFALFMIALLFLMAGLLAAPSLQRNGIPGFVRARLLRLGLPFLVFTLFLWPALMYALYHPLGMAPGSYWEEFLSEEGYIDAGPLWFVGVLLIFSLAYAGAVRFGDCGIWPWVDDGGPPKPLPALPHRHAHRGDGNGGSRVSGVSVRHVAASTGRMEPAGFGFRRY